MPDSALQLILPAEAEFPVTVGAFISIVEETAIELLTKHLNTELTRLLALFLGTFEEAVHLGEPFSNQEEHLVLSKVHSADQTHVFPKDLLALELKVALPCNEETPESELKGEADS